MKYLLALLMLVACSAWADWKQVAEGTDTVLFVDFGSIRKDGNKLRVWQMTNFSKPRIVLGQEVLSLRARVEFDCKKEQEKLVSVSLFSQYFATGDLIKLEDKGADWKDIPPDTVGWDVFKSVCKPLSR
jgi:hypothetical protein